MYSIHIQFISTPLQTADSRQQTADSRQQTLLHVAYQHFHELAAVLLELYSLVHLEGRHLQQQLRRHSVQLSLRCL